jgi:hypothetical protein
MRSESRKVRRVMDPSQHKVQLDRSRAIWRERSAALPNEFLADAA